MSAIDSVMMKLFCIAYQPEREVHCIYTYTLSALFPASMMFSSSPGERFSCLSTFTTSALWA